MSFYVWNYFQKDSRWSHWKLSQSRPFSPSRWGQRMTFEESNGEEYREDEFVEYKKPKMKDVTGTYEYQSSKKQRHKTKYWKAFVD